MAGPDYRIGVDLGGTNVRAAVVDSQGKIQSAVRTQIADDRSPERVVAIVREAITGALSEAGNLRSRTWRE